MKKVVLEGSGGREEIPAFGIGTWRMGESSAAISAEIDLIQSAVDAGVGLIDTAEMYGDGGAERMLGKALTGGRRERVFLVSKVYPHNATHKRMRAACEASLRRLGIDRIDLYLLHWRGTAPMAEVADALEALRAAGKIRHWGVSNLDLEDLQELAAAPAGKGCAANQIYYSVSQRQAETAVLPWMRTHTIAAMAYCPLDQGRIARHARLAEVGRRHGASAAQVALAWLVEQQNVVVIPKSATREHLRANMQAMSLGLGSNDLADIDQVFARPAARQPLPVA